MKTLKQWWNYFTKSLRNLTHSLRNDNQTRQITGLFKTPQTAPLWHTVSAGECRRPSALAHETSVTIQHESLPWVSLGRMSIL